MDGYKSLDKYETIDSFDRSKTLWPDSAVFQYNLEDSIVNCTEVSLVQAAIPNILYNITNENNQLIVIHEEFGKKFLLHVVVSPGHYDVYNFVDEITRLLNIRLLDAYKINKIYGIYKDLSDNLVIAAEERNDGSIVLENGTILTEDEIVKVNYFGQYTVQFLSIKGRMRMYFSLPSVVFTLIFANPSDETEGVFYEQIGITPDMLNRTSYSIMGFDNTRNYSNRDTKYEGYEPEVIGLTRDDIDTYDTANIDMVMSTRYMMIYYEPYIYLHVLELMMDPQTVPRFWTDPSGMKPPGYDIKTIHTTDPNDPRYGKILFRPLAKIILNTLPGEVVYYNQNDYPNFLSMRFFDSKNFKNFDKVTCVWTKKDGTILDFNMIDVVVVLKFVEAKMPFDE